MPRLGGLVEGWWRAGIAQLRCDCVACFVQCVFRHATPRHATPRHSSLLTYLPACLPTYLPQGFTAVYGLFAVPVRSRAAPLHVADLSSAYAAARARPAAIAAAAATATAVEVRAEAVSLARRRSRSPTGVQP